MLVGDKRGYEQSACGGSTKKMKSALLGSRLPPGVALNNAEILLVGEGNFSFALSLQKRKIHRRKQAIAKSIPNPGRR